MARDFHSVADAFPLMAGKELDDLVEDVRTHGLREPIWLRQDGRGMSVTVRHGSFPICGKSLKYLPSRFPSRCSVTVRHGSRKLLKCLTSRSVTVPSRCPPIPPYRAGTPLGRASGPSGGMNS